MTVGAQQRLIEILRRGIAALQRKVADAADAHSRVGVAHVVQAEFRLIVGFLFVVAVLGRVERTPAAVLV